MADHLWQSGVLILISWGMATALRRAPARYHTAIWWLAIGKLLLPVGLLGAIVAWLEPAVGAGESLSRWGRVVPAIPGFRILESVPGADEPGWLFVFVTLIWGVGAVAVPLAGWARVRHLGASSGPSMPRVIGVLRPRVVVPDAVRSALPDEELAAVWLHEQTHCRRRDPQKGLLVLLAGSLFWFFPLAWLAIRRLRAATEMACDEAVVAAGVRPEAYARALARTVSLGLVPAMGGLHLARSHGSVSHRIDRIRHPGRFVPMRRHDLIRIAAFTLLAVSVVSALGATVVQQVSREELAQRMGPGHEGLLQLHGVGQRVTLLAKEEPLGRVLRRLGRRAGFDVVIADAGGERLVDLELRNVSIGEALVTLGREHGLEYRVSDDGVLLTVGAPLRIGGDIQSPERIRYVVPQYPQQARDLGIEGVVIMEVTLDAKGRVSDTRVLRGLHPLLDAAAVEAAMQWLYTPTLYNGEPVEVLLTVTVQFQLR